MIERENRQRVISVQSTLGAGVALGDVVAEVEKLISEYHTPDGVDLEWAARSRIRATPSAIWACCSS